MESAQQQPPKRYRFGWIIEQALGHRTHAENLLAEVSGDAEAEATWGLLPYELGSLGARIPLYRSNWTVRAGLRARRALRAMARTGPLDALFFHTQVPAVLTSDWVGRIPTVVSLDATPLQYDQLGGPYGHEPGPAWLERLKWRLNRAAFHRARHVVAWSQWAKDGVIADYGVAPERVTVIPPGVHTRDWQRPTPRQAHAGAVRILFVGADAERKGGLLLLEALRALRETLPIELDLVTRSQLRAQPGARVHSGLSANSGDLRALYHQADIFCLPTDGDCLPLVLAEAAASGLPAIATTIAAIPELVRHGETGLLIERGDLGSLVASLRRLASDVPLRLSMGERAAALAASEYDAGANAQRLLRLMKLSASQDRGR